MKEIVVELIAKETGLSKAEVENLVEIPPTADLGDFAFPCFVLAKKEKKNPLLIAETLTEKLRKKLPEEITNVGFKSAYVNFFIDKKVFAEKILKEALKKDFGSSKEGKGKTIVVDYSGPNLGKPMHVGHIRSTIIGDSLIKLAKMNGDKPVGINYLGDIGLHLGKLIVAWEMWLDKKALKENPTGELLRLYVKFCNNEKSEIKEGQDEDDYSTNEWTLKAKEKLKLVDEGDEKTIKIWKEIEKASLQGFDRVYKKLNVTFDEMSGQSKFSESGKELVLNGVKKKVFEKDETGAVYAEFDNLPKKYILRNNGTAFYMTQDIGAAVDRYKKYKFDKMLYITDYRQQLHFQQLFSILAKLNYSFSKNCDHLGFGTVNFGKEIMATREGKVILLEEVIDKVCEKVEKENKRRNTAGNPLTISLAAIKYAILRIEPSKDVDFSWEQALSFEGNTGPYLLYSYARASSILRKVKKKEAKFKILELTAEESALVTKISNYPQIVKRAYEELAPNLIANYSYELAKLFNEFYHAHPVLGSKEEAFRLKLIEAFRNVSKSSLSLLGIEVLDEM